MTIQSYEMSMAWEHGSPIIGQLLRQYVLSELYGWNIFDCDKNKNISTHNVVRVSTNSRHSYMDNLFFE